MELDHIVPRARGGDDSIDNAIAVCFDCHAEAHAYNPEHPLGRKFTSEELRAHKAQWLHICQSRVEVFFEAMLPAEVGPIQALVDELEFNETIAGLGEDGLFEDKIPPPFWMDQFKRAISTGALSMVHPKLREHLLGAYVAMAQANQAIARAGLRGEGYDTISRADEQADTAVRSAKRAIDEALATLRSFLAPESDAERLAREVPESM